MKNKTILSVVAALSLNVSGAIAMEYKGPTFDLSQVQPEFRVGYLPDEPAAETLARNECMIPYYEAALNVPVKQFTFNDNAGAIEAFLGGNLDMIWFGSSAYSSVEIEKPGFAAPIMTRVQPTGDIGYYSIMIALKESGIESVADMKGKHFAFGDPDSTSGTLVPSVVLPEELGMPIENHFGEVSFSGSHEATVLGVLNGDYDAGVTWVSGVGEWDEGYTSGQLNTMVKKGVLNMDDIVQIWSSALIPNGPHTVPATFPTGGSTALLGMQKWIHDNDKECSENHTNGEVKGWISVDSSFYEAIVAVKKAQLESAK